MDVKANKKALGHQLTAERLGRAIRWRSQGRSEKFAGRIRLGMVGGGQGAFIGAVHRIAARMDDQYELVAGALSSDPKRAKASGLELGLARTAPTAATRRWRSARRG